MSEIKTKKEYAQNLLAAIISPNFKKADAETREKMIAEMMKVSAEINELDKIDVKPH